MRSPRPLRPLRTRRPRRFAALLLCAVAGLLPSAVPAGAAAPSPVPGTLGAYDISSVYSAGVSSGGYMATQLHVAYSGTFEGSAMFASGPYDCARGQLATALNACMDTTQNLQLAALEQSTRDRSAQGRIDPVENLAGDPVYVFSGSGDSTVKRPVADALADYYGRFGARVAYDRSTAAGHAWITPLGPNTCAVTQSPYLNDCGTDAEGALLGHLLGAVAAPGSGTGGSLIRFDQNAYAPGGSAAAVSMGGEGFAYVPASCAQGARCRLLVALHGCKQGYAYQGFGTRFVQGAYLNEYADTNDMIVLYPQAAPTATLENPNGCWNWWGYLGDTAYAQHGGKQIEAVMGMVRALRGTGTPPESGRTVLSSTDAEDGYVKAAADGSGASVGTLEDLYGLALGRGTDGRVNRLVVSFDTSRIPAGKEITRAWLTVTRSSGSGDPWASPAGNRLLVDLRSGCFGGCAVEAGDWSAAASVAGAARIDAFASGSAVSTDLSAQALAALNRGGVTQFRLGFAAAPTGTAYLFVNRDAPVTLTVEYR
ncbi:MULTISPECIES: PHB depolymerase family esterase [unclassified Streptomyces]|uniref:extracellular catalytic domain type 2 short-chain-length polyhydroxyalkanoate depolymerase n=1 Tax=unclassified Streptomyces TaxID=2593676 RepID=UPI0006FB2F52|nr:MULTISPECIES: PHB depolymerase family esterase [unclassified Streptomyces]KQX46199.1 poly (3-hydroxybutyrate) depolymerase [Streptomyces sp. Root1304]KRA80984.1 poly (3-hydroxybutyrate) depolymerase [Streptomyces sp. Root66D1]